MNRNFSRRETYVLFIHKYFCYSVVRYAPFLLRRKFLMDFFIAYFYFFVTCVACNKRRVGVKTLTC